MPAPGPEGLIDTISKLGRVAISWRTGSVCATAKVVIMNVARPMVVAQDVLALDALDHTPSGVAWSCGRNASAATS